MTPFVEGDIHPYTNISTPDFDDDKYKFDQNLSHKVGDKVWSSIDYKDMNYPPLTIGLIDTSGSVVLLNDTGQITTFVMYSNNLIPHV